MRGQLPDRRYAASRVLLCVTLLFSVLMRSAQALPEPETVPSSDKRDRADVIHGAIGRGVRGLGDRLDRFFSDQRVLAEEQTSRLYISPTFELIEGGQTSQTLPIRINVVLPRLKNRWRLRVTSIEDRDDDLVADSQDALPEGRDKALPREPGEGDQTSTFVTLNYNPVAKLKRNLSVGGGPKVRDGSVKLFLAVRLRVSTQWGLWTPSGRQQIYYDGNKFGERTSVDLDRPLSKVTLFRATSAATYTEGGGGFELEQGFSVRRLLDDDRAVQTALTAIGNTQPNTRVERYVVSFTYRQRLWKDWLTASVRPELRYPRETRFEPERALILSLQAVF